MRLQFIYGNDKSINVHFTFRTWSRSLKMRSKDMYTCAGVMDATMLVDSGDQNTKGKENQASQLSSPFRGVIHTYQHTR